MNDMKQCPNGHFYYPDKTPVCPYCNPATVSQDRTIGGGARTAGPAFGFGGTSPAGAETQPNDGATVPVMNSSGFSNDGYERTIPVNPFPFKGVTVPVFSKKEGFDPVVGWLICIAGAARGQDYRIRSGNNFIGRSASMDIVIDVDDTISKIKMAFVTYDIETNTFHISPGEGRNLVHINGELLLTPQKLAPYDRIKLGNTELIFIPLCGEKFDWK